MNEITRRIPLVNSPHLDPVTELKRIDANSVTIKPEDFSDWEAMFAAYPDAIDYLLTPGDYRYWGRLQKQNQPIPGGTPERRRTIRYYAPNEENPLHPVRRVNGREVVIDDAEIRAGSYVIFHGLTFRPTQPTQSTFILRPNAMRNVVDQCLFEEHTTSGVTVYGSHNTVQRCVMRNAKKGQNRDTYGVMTTLQRGIENVGCRVLDCEIYNHVDQIAATVSSKPGTAFDELRDCIIDGNDFYNTREYVDAGNPMENLLDYKVGTNTENSNFITNNRFWGLAESDGGSGGSNHSLLFHRAARGWVVRANIIGENVSTDAAIYESVWQPVDEPENGNFQERRNQYLRNIIYNHSRALGMSLDGYAEANTVINCDYLLYRSSASGRLSPTLAVVKDTRINQVISIEDPDTVAVLGTYDPELNMAPPPALIQYQRRRWTSPQPEWMTIRS